MRLFGTGQREQESAEEFWRRTEEARGGPVGMRTVATYLGRSGSRILRLSGLIYTIGGTVWFEDFEKDNWFARIVDRGTRYEKTVLSFLKADVEFTRSVTSGTANGCILGSVDPQRTRPLSAFRRLFATRALQIHLHAGHSMFFEVLMEAELIRFLA
jgi:hypothetical protein